jgi:hypothetical protein
MGQTWDSTPTSVTGRHRAPRTQRQATRRTLAKLAIAFVVLATVLATLATDPGALTAVAILATPFAIATGACLLVNRILTAVGR